MSDLDLKVTEKFIFRGKAWFSWATLSCDIIIEMNFTFMDFINV